MLKVFYSHHIILNFFTLIVKPLCRIPLFNFCMNVLVLRVRLVAFRKHESEMNRKPFCVTISHSKKQQKVASNVIHINGGSR